VSWNLRDVTVLCWFNARSGGNLDVVVTNGTAKIPLSNGSDIRYLCSVFVEMVLQNPPIIFTHPAR
jgi:hypothetical protein